MIIIVIVVRSDDNNHHGSRWKGKVPSAGDNIPHQGPDHRYDNQPLWSSFSSSLVLGSKLGELSWDQKTSSWVTLLPTSRPAWLQMVTIVIIIIILTGNGFSCHCFLLIHFSIIIINSIVFLELFAFDRLATRLALLSLAVPAYTHKSWRRWQILHCWIL